MMIKPLSLAVTVFVGLISLISSGCMLSPNQDDQLGYPTQSVRFQATTLSPNEVVSVQALHPRTGTWQTIDQFTTSNYPIAWGGANWYYGDTHVVIPEGYWFYKNGQQAAQVRTTSATNEAYGMSGMLAFEHGFIDWFWLDKSVNQALDRSVGQSAYIYR